MENVHVAIGDEMLTVENLEAVMAVVDMAVVHGGGVVVVVVSVNAISHYSLSLCPLCCYPSVCPCSSPCRCVCFRLDVVCVFLTCVVLVLVWCWMLIFTLVICASICRIPFTTCCRNSDTRST